MKVVFVPDEAPVTYSKSLFLAGTSPRNADHPNWRKDALTHLEAIGYDGVVFVPLPKDGDWGHGFDDQVEWEQRHLRMADQIVFWVPRDMRTLPGLTTNIEWGMWFDSGKAVLGFPEEAPHMRYLTDQAREQSVPVFHTMGDTLNAAVTRLGAGASRTGGEREVPLHIWTLPHFQNWYTAQKEAGNRLDGAEVLFTFRVGPSKSFTFAFVLHVDVHVTAEGRNKTNEFVFSRTDVATIVAYHRPKVGCIEETDWALRETKIVLVREFRSPARTRDGMIRECPGGSSWKPGDDPFVTMIHELEEETGLGAGAGFSIEPSRIRKIGSRQVCGTLSSHQAHVFACELTETEMMFLARQQTEGIIHGVEADTERTHVEIHKLRDLLGKESDIVDWSVLGMILTAVLSTSDNL